MDGACGQVAVADRVHTCCLPPHQQPTHACHCGHRWTGTGRSPE